MHHIRFIFPVMLQPNLENSDLDHMMPESRMIGYTFEPLQAFRVWPDRDGWDEISKADLSKSSTHKAKFSHWLGFQ